MNTLKSWILDAIIKERFLVFDAEKNCGYEAIIYISENTGKLMGFQLMEGGDQWIRGAFGW